MSRQSDEFRRKADELLSLAAAEADMKKRSHLIDEAAHWHRKALDAAGLDGRAVATARKSRP